MGRGRGISFLGPSGAAAHQKCAAGAARAPPAAGPATGRRGRGR